MICDVQSVSKLQFHMTRICNLRSFKAFRHFFAGRDTQLNHSSLGIVSEARRVKVQCPAKNIIAELFFGDINRAPGCTDIMVLFAIACVHGNHRFRKPE